MPRRFYEQVMGVYFDDLDSYQILHNARYFLLFERTLGEFWQELGFGVFQSTQAPERFHYVRANSIEYASPVYGVGRVRVRVWIERLGTTSLTFGFCLMPLNEDRQHAVGKRTVVCVDPDTQRSKPWGDAFRKQLEPWIV
jgi:acyl-CoA thioester hydrolase